MVRILGDRASSVTRGWLDRVCITAAVHLDVILETASTCAVMIIVRTATLAMVMAVDVLAGVLHLLVRHATMIHTTVRLLLLEVVVGHQQVAARRHDLIVLRLAGLMDLMVMKDDLLLVVSPLTLRLVSLTMRVLLLVDQTHGRSVQTTTVTRTTASSPSNNR